MRLRCYSATARLCKEQYRLNILNMPATLQERICIAAGLSFLQNTLKILSTLSMAHVYVWLRTVTPSHMISRALRLLFLIKQY